MPLLDQGYICTAYPDDIIFCTSGWSWGSGFAVPSIIDLYLQNSTLSDNAFKGSWEALYKIADGPFVFSDGGFKGMHFEEYYSFVESSVWGSTTTDISGLSFVSFIENFKFGGDWDWGTPGTYIVDNNTLTPQDVRVGVRINFNTVGVLVSGVSNVSSWS